MSIAPDTTQRPADTTQRAAVTGPAGTWELLPHFVLRTAGMPLDRLDTLRAPQATVALRETLDVQDWIAGAQQRFASELFPALLDREQARGAARARFRALHKAARAVRKGWPLGPEAQAALLAPTGVDPAGQSSTAQSSTAQSLTDQSSTDQSPTLQCAEFVARWQAAFAELERLGIIAQRVCAAELVTIRTRLRGLAQDPAFREAVWLSNPEMHDVGLSTYDRHWRPDARPSKIRQLERRIFTYAQRLSAKNETTSFFGPLGYGRFDDQPGAGLRLAAGLRRRQAYFAFGAAQALATVIAQDPAARPFLPPRPHPLSDGSVQVVDLAIPPATLHPLAWLRDWVAALPAGCPARQRWLDPLVGLCHQVGEFAQAGVARRHELARDIEARYRALGGRAPERKPGRMFNDRTLVYEECLGPVEELRLGPAQLAQVRDGLVPMAALCATAAAHERADLRDVATGLLSELGAPARPVPFVEFLAAWRRHRPPTGTATPRSDRLRHRLAALVAAASEASGDGVARLPAAQVLALCDPVTEPVALSPDVLLSASGIGDVAAGAFQVVLGEIHHGVQATGWMLEFADDAWRHQAELAAGAVGPGRLANLVLSRRMKTAPPEYPGLTVVAHGASQRPGALPLGALTVVLAGDSPRLLGPDREEICLRPPSFGVPAAYAPFACFSGLLVRPVPVVLGRHTPRVELSGAVYQRETWTLPSQALPAPGTPEVQLLAGCLRLQRDLGLPDRVYVRTSAEPKPVYIDFQSPLALELLAHLAAAVDEITVSEMLPGPEGLWLYPQARHCAELRTVMIGKPASSTGPAGVAP